MRDDILILVAQRLHTNDGSHVLRALFRVWRFHVREEIRTVNNVLRGFRKLIAAVE